MCQLRIVINDVSAQFDCCELFAILPFRWRHLLRGTGLANVYVMYRLNLVSRRYLDLGRVSSQMCMRSAMYEMPRH